MVTRIEVGVTVCVAVQIIGRPAPATTHSPAYTTTLSRRVCHRHRRRRVFPVFVATIVLWIVCPTALKLRLRRDLRERQTRTGVGHNRAMVMVWAWWRWACRSTNFSVKL
jgi:hypothetical protein